MAICKKPYCAWPGQWVDGHLCHGESSPLRCALFRLQAQQPLRNTGSRAPVCRYRQYIMMPGPGFAITGIVAVGVDDPELR
jgi:hypothetical protein